MAAPVLQQPGGFGRHLPTAGIGQAAPLIHLLPQLIDDGRGIVLLLFGGKPFALVKNDLVLLGFGDLRLRGLGMGVMNLARRRRSIICCVGWPCASSSQCRCGH